MLWCRQGAGKTELVQAFLITCAIWLPLLANIPKALAYAPKLDKWNNRGFLGVITAPNLDTARISFRRAKTIADSKDFSLIANSLGGKVLTANTEMLEFANGSMIKSLSGSINTCKRGQTADAVIFDESPLMSGYVKNNVYIPATSATGGMIVHLGTSNGRRNDFYDKMQLNINKYPYAHSVIPEWVARRENPAFGKAVDRRLISIPGGKNSMLYRQEYACEWELTGEGSLLSYHQFMASNGEHFRKQWRQIKGAKFYLGIDWGKTVDNTVCTLLAKYPDGRYEVVDWLCIPLGVPYRRQYPEIEAWIKAFRLPNLYGLSDSTGPGDAPTEEMQARLSERKIQPCVFNSSSKNEMYLSLENLLPIIRDGKVVSHGSIFWPKCDQENDQDWMMFSQQMQDCLLDRRGNYITWAAPTRKDAQAEGDNPPHDDFCASLMLATLASTGYGREESLIVAMPAIRV